MDCIYNPHLLAKVSSGGFHSMTPAMIRVDAVGDDLQRANPDRETLCDFRDEQSSLRTDHGHADFYTITHVAENLIRMAPEKASRRIGRRLSRQGGGRFQPQRNDRC